MRPPETEVYIGEGVGKIRSALEILFNIRYLRSKIISLE